MQNAGRVGQRQSFPQYECSIGRPETEFSDLHGVIDAHACCHRTSGRVDEQFDVLRMHHTDISEHMSFLGHAQCKFLGLFGAHVLAQQLLF